MLYAEMSTTSTTTPICFLVFSSSGNQSNAVDCWLIDCLAYGYPKKDVGQSNLKHIPPNLHKLFYFSNSFLNPNAFDWRSAVPSEPFEIS